MFEYIEKLRKKSDKEKNRIAFFSAFAFSALIFIVWASVVVPGVKNDNKAEVAAVGSSPISDFSNVVSDFIIQVKTGMSDLKSSVSGLSTSTQYYSATSSVGNSSSEAR
jgi:hypothetical protein